MIKTGVYWYSRYDSFINDFFVSKKVKIKAEIVLSTGGAYFSKVISLALSLKQENAILRK